MPLQTTITNLLDVPLHCSWIPPHGRTLPPQGSIVIQGDVTNYHLFPCPNWRQIKAIYRASVGGNKKVNVVVENV